MNEKNIIPHIDLNPTVIQYDVTYCEMEVVVCYRPKATTNAKTRNGFENQINKILKDIIYYFFCFFDYCDFPLLGTPAPSRTPGSKRTKGYYFGGPGAFVLILPNSFGD